MQAERKSSLNENALGNKVSNQRRSTSMYQYVLFDLDGTLTNPEIGITNCVMYALEKFGITECLMPYACTGMDRK